MGNKQKYALEREKLAAQIKMNEQTNSTNLRIARDEMKALDAQTAANIKAAELSGMAGIISSIAGANQTTEQIKQRLPVESGAATIASWDLAQKWNTSLKMSQQGYQKAAIDYELSGKSYKALEADPQYNSLKMQNQARQDMVQSIQMFGIKSPTNPYGVSLSQDDWYKMHQLKDPRSVLEVDPAESVARQRGFAEWEANMRSQNLGLLVDIYKNPQLAGSNILAMKGKDPMIDESMLPLIQKVSGGGGGGGGTDWSQVISAMTKGENNAMSGQVKKLMEMGIVDKYGQINTGTLMQHIPPSLQQTPEFSMTRELTEQEKIRLADDYKRFSEIQVDPKLIKEEPLGYGVSRKVKLNADGSIAGHSLEGYMTDAMGNQVHTSMSGLTLQEWYDRQSSISGLGPLFPGMLAPVTNEEKSGKFEPGFWGKNQLAQSNGGNTGSHKKPASTTPSNTTPGIVPLSSPKPPTNNAAPAPSTTPQGYGGAPLAAGDK